MVMTSFVLDTQAASAEDMQSVLHGGQIVHAAGLVNTRWKEESALHLANQLALKDVAWEYAADDTPGMLELTVWYPFCTEAQVQQRLSTVHGLEELDVSGL